jgi:hypothetical protein
LALVWRLLLFTGGDMTHITIEQAKAQRIADAFEDLRKNYGISYIEESVDINQALAAPTVQEPAAWIEHEWSGSGLRHLHFERREQSVRDEVMNPIWTPLYTTPPAQPSPVQKPEIDGATMAGMDASIGHLSALVDELRLLLGCAMDNFKMLHNAAKPDDGPDMDAIIPAIVFAKFVNQDAALRYAIKHSAHDGMITATPAAQPAIPDAIHHTDLSEHPKYISGWNDYRAAMMEMMK